MNSSEILALMNETITFVPPITEGIVIKVYDGDTFTLASKLPYDNSPMYRFSVRINRINCPEIKSKNDEEKECAQIAKKCVSDLILGKKVQLHEISTDKYGRVLAEVTIGNVNIADYLLTSRLAISYDGGTKKQIDNWMAYHVNGV
jgi:micrococcal nuclease